METGKTERRLLSVFKRETGRFLMEMTSDKFGMFY
jgi:hypothetical protein